MIYIYSDMTYEKEFVLKMIKKMKIDEKNIVTYGIAGCADKRFVGILDVPDVFKP